MAVGKGIDRTAGKRVLAGLAVLGIVLISGLLAAWGVSPSAKHAISAADEVASRFPADWNERDTKGAVPQPATFTLASASASEALPYDTAILFNPNPTWTLPANAAPDAKPEPQSEPAPEARSEAKPEPKPEIKPAPKAEAKPVVVASRSIAHVEHRATAPHPQHRESSILFNEAQLASIRARLKLSDYQQQYWPAVAAALHALGERAARAPVRVASAYAGEGPLSGVDPDGPEVQQLKSAAFPLIISMNDEQKNQVRTLARMMGLEQVASSF
ncbi:MAG TPA: hypothetical protein VGG01_19540 [Xanthobacteraceae bacterium]